jgi:hypothetical protein
MRTTEIGELPSIATLLRQASDLARTGAVSAEEKTSLKSIIVESFYKDGSVAHHAWARLRAAVHRMSMLMREAAAATAAPAPAVDAATAAPAPAADAATAAPAPAADAATAAPAPAADAATAEVRRS